MTTYVAAIAAAAFIAALLGSVHCMAMCGAIAGAVCRSARQGAYARIAGPLAYHAGRISSYALAGALIGGLGEAGLMLRGGSHSSHVLLYVAGVALILMALYVAGASAFVRAVETAGAIAWKRIEPLSKRLLPADTGLRAFGLGMVWGWLPCGMVYTALLAALALAAPLYGAIVMVAFGLGTLPAMAAVSVFAVRVRDVNRSRPLRLGASAAILAVGVFGIAKAAYPGLLDGLVALCIGSSSGL